MANPINVNSKGFINHVYMALTPRPEQMASAYTQGRLEKIGDGLAWHVTKLPQHIRSALNNPKVITVALTALALLTVQFAFYPTATYLAAQAVFTFAAQYITASGVKIAIYAAIQTAITGIGVRALGRFSNDELMDKWYNKAGV
jgi:hypothetical protein